VQQIVDTAADHKHCFTPPHVAIWFFGGVTKDMAVALQQLGVTVIGDREDVAAATLRHLSAVAQGDDEDDDDVDNCAEYVARCSGGNSWTEHSIQDCNRLTSRSNVSVEHVESIKLNRADHELIACSNTDFVTCCLTSVEVSDNSDSCRIAKDERSISSSITLRRENCSISNAPHTVHCTSSSTTASQDAATQMQDTFSKQCSVVESNVGNDRSRNCLDKNYSGSSSCGALFTTLGLPSYAGPMVANLDITTLICLCSNLCNGRNECDFSDAVLVQQAIRERASPVLPSINAFLQGERRIET
jgi:hypothetical protein